MAASPATVIQLPTCVSVSAFQKLWSAMGTPTANAAAPATRTPRPSDSALPAYQLPIDGPATAVMPPARKSGPADRSFPAQNPPAIKSGPVTDPTSASPVATFSLLSGSSD